MKNGNVIITNFQTLRQIFDQDTLTLNNDFKSLQLHFKFFYLD